MTLRRLFLMEEVMTKNQRLSYLGRHLCVPAEEEKAEGKESKKDEKRTAAGTKNPEEDVS